MIAPRVGMGALLFVSACVPSIPPDTSLPKPTSDRMVGFAVSYVDPESFARGDDGATGTLRLENPLSMPVEVRLDARLVGRLPPRGRASIADLPMRTWTVRYVPLDALTIVHEVVPR